MENHHFLMGKSTISMAIFHSYVSLPEGRWWLLGGELPTNRGCRLVHPIYKWDKERVNPLKSLGWTNPLTSRGMSHQVATEDEKRQIGISTFRIVLDFPMEGVWIPTCQLFNRTIIFQIIFVGGSWCSMFIHVWYYTHWDRIRNPQHEIYPLVN